MNNKLKKNFYLLTSTCLISGSLLFTGCSYQPDISYNNGAKDPLSSFVNTLKPENNEKSKSTSSQTDNLNSSSAGFRCFSRGNTNTDCCRICCC